MSTVTNEDRNTDTQADAGNRRPRKKGYNLKLETELVAATIEKAKTEGLGLAQKINDLMRDYVENP